MSEVPRGIRNNNPGNLELDGIKWLGMSEVQDDPPYVKFDRAEYGIRAIARDLKTMQREGISTISEAITKWAPPTENNTAAYIAAVSAAAGVPADKAVDFTSIMAKLVSAIIQHENGQQPYSPSLIDYGISLA